MKLQKQGVYSRIKDILESARSKAYRAVNFVMVQAYWEVGRVIVEEEQKGKSRAEYGISLLNNLSIRLTKDFGKGFDERNLRFIRAFYLHFPIRNALRTELSWTHYRLLLSVEKEKAREFYMKECVEGNWSTRQLDRQICSLLYERLLLSRERQALLARANKQEKQAQSVDIIKDPYVLEFLNLKENRNFVESDIESGIIDKLQEFLLELGKGFSFVARQQRITVGGDHYYIDLVFYNIILKCFLLIDLKVGKLDHKDVGQMDFYVRYFEENLKVRGNNPTIGLILCSEKNEAIARYSILKDSKRIFASKYKLYLPTEKELAEEIEREVLQLKSACK